MAKGGYYDKNKDYSLAIKNAQASGASADTINRLQNERQNKIDSQYGGNDPYKGSSNIMGSSGSSSGSKKNTGSSGGSGGSLGTALGIGGLLGGIGSQTNSALNAWNNRNNGGGSYGGTTTPGNTDYHQQAIDAAMAGDYEGMMTALSNRQNKIDAQGGNDRGTSNWQILQELTSKYFPNGQPQQLEQPEFDFSYGSQMNSVVDSLLNSSLADWKQGDQYAALRKQYADNGEMSMSDLMGQVASRTGGLASSYAAQVGSQTYNDYMAKLEQAAQEMYQQNRSDQLNNLNALQQLYNNEYGAYQDALNQYNTDRNFQYQQQQDALSNQWKETEWNYGLTQDEWNKAAQQAETMAAYGDFSGYKALGYTDAQIANMQKQWQIQQALAAQESSGSTKQSTEKSSPTSGEPDMEGLFLAAYRSGNPYSFIANNYKKYGIEKSTGLSTDYKNWLEDYDDDANQAASTNFNQLYNKLSISLSEESNSNAKKNLNSFVNKYWDYLSDAQRNRITNLASRYGFSM